jgi:hypothetical protein
MARTGRPPKPVEELRRRGTARPDRHGATALAIVEPVEVKPYEVTALQAFDNVLEAGVIWLARTDVPALVMLRSMLEERDPLRADAMAGSTEARKMLRDLDKQIVTLLGQLGFDPASRSRLGLAEVKTQSKLEELRSRQGNR